MPQEGGVYPKPKKKHPITTRKGEGALPREGKGRKYEERIHYSAIWKREEKPTRGRGGKRKKPFLTEGGRRKKNKAGERNGGKKPTEFL